MKIALVTINQPSLNSACRLSLYLYEHEIDVFGKKDLTHNLNSIYVYDKLDDILEPVWEDYEAIICILAMGAVVRKIAPFLKDKATDPAVLVLNLALDRVVPLVGGHLGGANKLADSITSRLPNCVNFITTATDQTDTLAFEMLAIESDWIISNIKALPNISNRLINKQPVNVITYKSVFESIPNKKNLVFVDYKTYDFNTNDLNSVLIAPYGYSPSLVLTPRCYLGIGCNRGTTLEEIEEAFTDFIWDNKLEQRDILGLASFEAKADEVGLLEFAKKHGLDIKFYSKDDINALENEFSDSASTKFFGLKGVAEPSAVLASEYKELFIKKTVYKKKITIAGAI